MLLYFRLFLLLLILAITANAFHPTSIISSTRRMNLDMINHGQKFNKLSRAADQRKALLRALTTQILRHGRITTTLAKAKAVRSHVDKMITLAKKGTLHHRRQALAYIYDREVVRGMFLLAPEIYKDRQGGYCRIIRQLINRRGDNAKLATIELVE